MKRILITYIYIILLVSTNYSQDDKFDSLITAGINQIYSIKFEQAKETFTKVMNEYPEHPSGKFFDAMIIWWKILLDLDNEKYDDQFFDKLDIVIDMCDDILDAEPENIDAMFFKGGSLGFRGRLNSIRGNWFEAAADGKDALPLVHNAYALDTTNIDVKLGFGIYNYYAAVIPEQYPFVQPIMIFFPDGDKVKGLEQLEIVAEQGKFAKIETRYFLMTLYYSYENNFSEALHYAELLTEEFPNNPRFQRYTGRIYVRMNDYPTATEIFKEILIKVEKGLPGYNEKVKREALYYVGIDYKKTNNLILAEQYLKECDLLSRKIDEDEESGFLINSVLYLGNIYDLKGEREKAVKNYEEVLDFREFGQAQKKAEQYLEKPYKN